MAETNEDNPLLGLIVLAIIAYIGYSLFNYFFSSTKDQLTTFVECQYAARELGMTTASREIEKKANIFVAEHKDEISSLGSPSRLGMVFMDKIRKDLRGKSPEGQYYTIVKVYNSCADIHGQEKIGGLGVKYYLYYVFEPILWIFMND